MTDLQQAITDRGDGRKYFTLIENMADDDLNPYQYRLLGHYKRVCGANGGQCTEGVRKTAARCKMSAPMVIKTRRELESMGWLAVQVRNKKTKAGKWVTSGLSITIKDRWAENIARYADPVKPHEHPVKPHDRGCSQGLNKEELDQEKPNQEEPPPADSIDSVDSSATDPPTLPTAAGAAAESETIVIDFNLKRVSDHYENNIGLITQHTAENLKAACDEYPPDWIIEAINEAVDQNVRRWAYIKAILERWRAQGKDNERSPNTSARRADSKRGRRVRTPEKTAKIKANFEARERRRAAADPDYKVEAFEGSYFDTGVPRRS